jgi:hypothetical protein
LTFIVTESTKNGTSNSFKVNPAAPTGSSGQSFCSAASPTVFNLSATGSGILWYSASSGGSSLATSTALTDGTHYYASQTVNGCESVARLDVTVTVNTTPGAPTGAALQALCPGSVIAGLAASGTNILWYDAATGGNLLSSGTALVNNTHYYASQTTNNCESSSRLDVTVTINTAGTWMGTTNTDWNTGSNWCGGIPTSTTNVVINAGGNQPIIGTTGGVCHDLTLGSGASLTIDGSNTLAVSGSWSNSGTFIKNSSTVMLNGTNSTQTLTGATTFNNLTIDHTGTGEVYAAGSTLKVVGLCYVKTGKLISSSDYASVQIDEGSTLECIADGTIQVSTSWTNNGTFIAGTNGTVEFAGTTTTIQPGTGINSFYNILITT